jgi:hypothetical protein
VQGKATKCHDSCLGGHCLALTFQTQKENQNCIGNINKF